MGHALPCGLLTRSLMLEESSGSRSGASALPRRAHSHAVEKTWKTELRSAVDAQRWCSCSAQHAAQPGFGRWCISPPRSIQELGPRLEALSEVMKATKNYSSTSCFAMRNDTKYSLERIHNCHWKFLRSCISRTSQLTLLQDDFGNILVELQACLKATATVFFSSVN